MHRGRMAPALSDAAAYGAIASLAKRANAPRAALSECGTKLNVFLATDERGDVLNRIEITGEEIVVRNYRVKTALNE